MRPTNAITVPRCASVLRARLTCPYCQTNAYTYMRSYLLRQMPKKRTKIKKRKKKHRKPY